jgi:hypothetical protein
MPLSAPYISRALVRPIPFASNKTFRNAALANAGTLIAAFDVGLVVTDRNQFLGTANPSADPTQFAVGPYCDMGVFATGIGTVLFEYAVDSTCSYRTVNTVAIAANTWANVSELRVTGRFLRVTFTNTSGGAVTVEFGVYIRST